LSVSSGSLCNNPGCYYDDDVKVITPLRTRVSSPSPPFSASLCRSGASSPLPLSLDERGRGRELPVIHTCCNYTQTEVDSEVLSAESQKVVITEGGEFHHSSQVYRFKLVSTFQDGTKIQIYNTVTHLIEILYLEKCLIGDEFIDILRSLVLEPFTACFLLSDINGWHRCSFV
jgi:hypothetical protein